MFTPSQRTILCAIDFHSPASITEPELISFLHSRGRPVASNDMQALLDQELIARIDPEPMSGDTFRYRLTKDGAAKLPSVRDEELVENGFGKLTTACEVMLRAVAAGANDHVKVTQALKGAGFRDSEITTAANTVVGGDFVEEHSWGMMSKTPASWQLSSNGYLYLDNIGIMVR